jgi:hypothetical protein
MSDVMNKDDIAEYALLWTREQEELLKDWCDIANCFRWLHEQSSFKYRRINNKIALPVIVLSTLTGTANFGMKSLVPESSQQIASAIVGAVNIFCGVLTTVQTYFKYAELTEGHASASKFWSKFQRNLNIELAIEPAKRRHPNEFLKYCIDEYNKLKESSPIIPKDIALEFKNKFKKTQNIFKPDIYDHLGGTLTYLDYVSRNTRSPRKESNISELQSIRIDSETRSEFKPRDSMINHLPVKQLAKNFLGEEMNKVINKSVKDREYNLDTFRVIEKGTLNNKEAMETELKTIRPDIRGLINKLEGKIKSESISESLKSKDEEETIDLTETVSNINIDSVKNI